MKYHFLLYISAIFVFISCKNEQNEITKLNSFLQTNYEFNSRILNKYRGDYYMRIEEQPSLKNEKLNQLDSEYEALIFAIDEAIATKETNIEKIASKYHNILNEIPKIVDNRKDYLLSEFDSIEQTKTDSNEFRLICIKNKLIIAMTYAFEYASRPTYSADGLYKVKVNSVFSKTNKNGIKLTLTSKYGQTIKENRHILINEIEFNGKEKNVDYKLKDNFSFADIEFDSLQKGTYRIHGILRFYERSGKIDVPFDEVFKVK